MSSEFSHHRYDPLLREDQIELCRKAQLGDFIARNRLVIGSMRAVASRARFLYKPSNRVDLEDLINDGVLGLMRAIDKFDPSHGTAFLTYATPWIDNFIRTARHKDIEISNGDLHKMYRVRNAYDAAITSGKGHDASIQEAAMDQGMRLSTVLTLLAIMARGMNVSLDAPSCDDIDTMVDRIVDESPSADDSIFIKAMIKSVCSTIDRFRDQLNERESFILDRRILADYDDVDIESFRTIGDSFGVSHERMRQIEVIVKGKLQCVLLRSPYVRALFQGKYRSAGYSDRWWEDRKDHNLCICGRKSKLPSSACNIHKSKNHPRYSKEYFDTLTVNGTCRNHPRHPVEPGTAGCVRCNVMKKPRATVHEAL